MHTNYETDFYVWTQEQASLLRSGNLSAVDIENLAEEIESMGKRDKRSMVSELIRLLSHLLKWKYQSVRRGGSWSDSIDGSREEIEALMKDNHTFDRLVPDFMATAYPKAVKAANKQTGLPISTFPKQCPWSFEEIMQEEFYPD